MVTKRKPSQPTGCYWPCGFNNPLHREMPLALPIMKGQQFCFTRCGGCGANTFFPGAWPITHGLTAEQAKQMGLHVVTNVSIFKAKAKTG